VRIHILMNSEKRHDHYEGGIAPSWNISIEPRPASIRPRSFQSGAKDIEVAIQYNDGDEKIFPLPTTSTPMRAAPT
jgi:hypothetical protein